MIFDYPTIKDPDGGSRRRHGFPGKLFVVEGIDGSGKSTQLKLLERWLISQGYGVYFTEWNSSDLVKKTTKYGKKKNLLTPTTFSLLHATDFADRHQDVILPPLKAGMIVLADRYAYTAFARDVVRGVHPEWVRKLYGFAAPPDVVFYFRVPIGVALDRLESGRHKLKFYEAGMDLGLSADTTESFSIFNGQIMEEYERMVGPEGFQVVNATLPIADQQAFVREAVARELEGYQETLYGLP